MSMEEAAIDIRYLLDRRFPHKSAVRFVCDHYRLDEDSRNLLSRIVLPGDVSEKRKAKFLPCRKIKGNAIFIDGYNIIIGMESILEKKAFLCDDGVIRDVRGVFRNFKVRKTTESAIDILLQFLKENSSGAVCFLLDSQISKSGTFAEMLREKIKAKGLRAKHGLQDRSIMNSSSQKVLWHQVMA